eukprot:scaffold21297_cov62-Phaeocystis_antarctica.AAC.2
MPSGARRTASGLWRAASAAGSGSPGVVRHWRSACMPACSCATAACVSQQCGAAACQTSWQPVSGCCASLCTTTGALRFTSLSEKRARTHPPSEG